MYMHACMYVRIYNNHRNGKWPCGYPFYSTNLWFSMSMLVTRSVSQTSARCCRVYLSNTCYVCWFFQKVEIKHLKHMFERETQLLPAVNPKEGWIQGSCKAWDSVSQAQPWSRRIRPSAAQTGGRAEGCFTVLKLDTLYSLQIISNYAVFLGCYSKRKHLDTVY